MELPKNQHNPTLEGTARYAGFTSSSCGGLWPPAEAFFALVEKELCMLSWLTLGNFWSSVVTSVTFSSNLSNFQKNPKNPKKFKESKKNQTYPKSSTIQKNSKNPRKSKKKEEKKT